MIEIKNVNKCFGSYKAVNNVTMTMQQGQLVSLIGPNGSGKTTLIKSILGLVNPEQGEILVDQRSIKSSYSYRDMIGYMPQMGRFPDHVKVKQLFNLYIQFRNIPKDNIDYELFNEFEIPALENKTIRALSGGMRQKVSASLAFLFKPKVLILDEPTAGLDPISAESFKRKIHKEHAKGKLVIITSHVLSDIEDITTHVAYMQDGSLQFFDSYERLKETSGESKLNKAIAYLMHINKKEKN